MNSMYAPNFSWCDPQILVTFWMKGQFRLTFFHGMLEPSMPGGLVGWPPKTMLGARVGSDTPSTASIGYHFGRLPHLARCTGALSSRARSMPLLSIPKEVSLTSVGLRVQVNEPTWPQPGR